MKKALMRTVLTGSLVFATCAASADDSDLFDDRFYVAPMASLTGNRGNSSSTDGWGGALAIGKVVVPHLGVELVGDYLRYRGKTATTPGTGLLCGVLTSCPDQVSQLPTQSIYGGGIGVNLYASAKDAHGVFLHGDAEGGDRFIYNIGLGLDVPFLERALYLRGEILYHKEADYNPGPLFHLGVRIPFGSMRPAEQPAPPPPVEVVPVEQPAPAAEAALPASPPPPPCQPPVPGQPISFEGCKAGDTIVLRGVNFEFNKATLTVNAKTLLDQVADALLARKDIKVEIDGHTDGKGSAPYNQKLSEARAASVMHYLAGRGIEAGRMSSKGFGKSLPIADNSTDEGRELNRRVELKVIESGGVADQPAEAQPTPAPLAEAAAAMSRNKHATRRHKKAAPVDLAPAAAPSSEAPAQPEPAPAAAEPAPQEPGPAPTDSQQSAPPGDEPAPTEPAPAPPAPPADKLQ